MAGKAENRPGVMLYYDALQAIEELDAEDAKQVIGAILRYSRDGETPDFHGALAAIWRFIQPSIDRDGERYKQVRAKGLYMTYCRKCKEVGTSALPFDEWVQHSDNDTLTTSNNTLAVENVPSPLSSSSSVSSSSSSSPSTPRKGKTASRAQNGSQPKKADAFAEFAGDDTEMLASLRGVEEMRKKIKKPLTDRAKERMLSKLAKMSDDRNTQIEILNQTEDHCWQELYPLKQDAAYSPKPPSRSGGTGCVDKMDGLRAAYQMFCEEEGR